MVLKIQVYYIFSTILFVYSTDIILKLDTKQIIDSILSEASVKYLTKLAQVFAKKAAETFIKEIKNKEHLLTDTNRAETTKKPVHKLRKTSRKNKSKEELLLNEKEAYKLLEEPPPDGDNLGWHSEERVIDDEDTKETERIPVYGMMKVNGVYVRRLLGVGAL